MTQLPVLRFVRTHGLSILKQLQLEEILLRKCGSNYLILNSDMREEDTAIVLGMSGKVAELVNLDHLAAKPVQLIRRYTGGGTVVVDKSTLFATFIMNAKDVPCPAYPRDIMGWSEGSVYGPVFDQLTGTKGNFAMRENDYTIGDRKVGGNAQTITKTRWVHHTSFLWSFEPEKMRYLQLPKKRPDYRQSREHESFLTCLDQHVGSKQAFEAALCARLAGLYDFRPVAHAEIEGEAREMMQGSALESVVRTRVESAPPN